MKRYEMLAEELALSIGTGLLKHALQRCVTAAAAVVRASSALLDAPIQIAKPRNEMAHAVDVIGSLLCDTG